MKFRYYILILVCFLQNNAYSMVFLDNKITYIEFNGKANLQFNYPFSDKNDLEDRLSVNTDLNCTCLQRITENTQMGFKAVMLHTFKSNVLEEFKHDFSDFNTFITGITEGYLIFKNKKFGSIEYGKRPVVSQSMLTSTSKFRVGAGGVNSSWKSYVNLPDIIAKPGRDLKLESWKVMSYISPEIKHFQLGLSYENAEKLIGGGLTYRNSLTDKIAVTAVVTGELVYQSEGNNQLKHWYGGLYAEYSQLSCALLYGNINERGIYYINAGIGYRSESNKLSATYFTSLGKNQLSSYAISLERPLVMGTSYYFDIVRFKVDESTGYVFLAGLKLSL